MKIRDAKRKKLIEFFDEEASKRGKWQKKSNYYYKDINKLCDFLTYPGSNVLEIGCGTGDLLEFLRENNDCKCTGIDFSSKMIDIAKKRFAGKGDKKHNDIKFYKADAEDFNIPGQKGKFDVIILSDLIGVLPDIQKVLEHIKKYCKSGTRIIISFYNFLWEPILNISGKLKLTSKIMQENWLSVDDVNNLLALTGYDNIKKGTRLLLPKYIPLVSSFFNTYVARLPLIRRLCLYTYIVARPVDIEPRTEKSVSVIIAAMNEKGNIENAVLRTPKMGKSTEIIFVEGGSKDGTYEEIARVAKKYSGEEGKKRGISRIIYAKQDGKGKGDAVRKGFDLASGEILMILDADLTVPPEDLPKFYEAIASNKGEFINGTRLVYPMEDEAMRTLNLIGNKGFSMIFTWILDQRFKDTLCGTKVISKKNYERLKKNRKYFGDFDPFGDFDLIFGASKLNLKIIEVPIRYGARTYGTTNIQRFKHGWLLIQMSLFAMKKIKFK